MKSGSTLLDESKTRLNLVFLDACRNNPYARGFRSADAGLARVSAPSGTLISYATRPGSVAADGEGRNGLYTSKLLAQMDSSIQIELSLKQVVTAVKAASQGKQEPWMEGSIEGDFCFPGCAAGGSSQAMSAMLAPVILDIPITDDAEGMLWHAAQSGGVEEDVRTYLRQYPNGRYVALANALKQRFAEDAVQANAQKEQEAWLAAGKTNTELGYQGYLNAYPAGRYIALVKGRLDKLKADYLEIKKGCLDCPEMISIPGKNYEIGKYEVTQKEWRDVIGNNPSKFSSCGYTCPVEQVSWNDVQEFIGKLNQKTGKQYRLPTEAEWEYACYGGIQSEYCGGNDLDAVGWHDKNSNDTTHPVGQKQANGYGLYDMSGNVYEWISDCWEGDCTKRVIRGGSGVFYSWGARAAERGFGKAENQSYLYGFRLSRTLASEVTQPTVSNSAQTEHAQKGYVVQGGLSWTPATLAAYKTWTEANSYCTTIINGQNGWRLPTKEELAALYASGAMNGQGWSMRGTWSSTPDGTGDHYLINLSDGRILSDQDKFAYYVTCVR